MKKIFEIACVVITTLLIAYLFVENENTKLKFRINDGFKYIDKNIANNNKDISDLKSEIIDIQYKIYENTIDIHKAKLSEYISNRNLEPIFEGIDKDLKSKWYIEGNEQCSESFECETFYVEGYNGTFLITKE